MGTSKVAKNFWMRKVNLFLMQKASKSMHNFISQVNIFQELCEMPSYDCYLFIKSSNPRLLTLWLR